jgi:hypothetical protein
MLRKLLPVMLLLLLAAPVSADINVRVLDLDCGDIPTDTDFEDEFDLIYGFFDPDGVEDASANAAAHQATKDPTGALPTDLRDEIHELRYKLDQLQPNNTYWYDAYNPHEYGHANIVLNGGFEYWTNGTTSAPDGWELVGGTTVSQTITTNVGYTGDAWAVQVTSAGITSNGIKHTFTNLKASTTYTVVARTKATAGDTVKASTTGAASNLSQTSTTQTWVYSINGQFTTDATPTDVVLTLGSDTSGDIVFFDNLMVVEGAMAHGYARHTPSVPITHPPFKGLVVENSVVSTTERSDVTIDIDADWLVVENATGHRLLLQNVDETCDITTVGVVNGLDAGSESADKTYYPYIIYNPSTGAQDSLLSSSLTSPVLPSGYTYYKAVSLCRNDSASDIVEYKQVGDKLMYAAPKDDTEILQNGSDTSFTDVDATNYTGTNAICKTVLLGWYVSSPAGGSVDFFVRPNGSSVSNGREIGNVRINEAEHASGEFMMYLDSSQTFEYKGGALANLNISVNACFLNL